MGSGGPSFLDHVRKIARYACYIGLSLWYRHYYQTALTLYQKEVEENEKDIKRIEQKNSKNPGSEGPALSSPLEGSQAPSIHDTG